MEQFKDYFKDSKEVESFFNKEVLKFAFMSDNVMYFESLNPTIIDGCLVYFELAFYYNDCCDFFAYSSFEDWLGKFQLSEVKCISEDTRDATTMYFKEYKINN